MFDDEVFGLYETKRSAPRIPFTSLLEYGLLLPGQVLYFNKDQAKSVTVLADGSLRAPDGIRGSIHKIGAHVGHLPACNGWEHWYYESSDGSLMVIDSLREAVRKKQDANGSDTL
jgi:modification methylase